jgi:hypothetical protein
MHGYASARKMVDSICELFSDAQKLLWKGDSYLEQFEAMRRAAVEKHGDLIVGQQLEAAHALWKDDQGLKPITAVWFVLALSLSKDPVLSFTVGDTEISHGDDIGAQVCNMTHGDRKAWDESLRIHPGLLRLSSACEAVSSLWWNINLIANTPISPLVS